MMKYEYLKGSEKDFECAPEWATVIASGTSSGHKFYLEGMMPGLKYGSLLTGLESQIYDIHVNSNIIAERRPIIEPSWDGVGLPPVGSKVEWMSDKYGWLGGTIAAYDERYPNVAIIRHNDGYTGCHRNEIRTHADKKRDAAVESLMRIVCSPSQAYAIVNKIYDAIAAGKIPGVKLVD